METPVFAQSPGDGAEVETQILFEFPCKFTLCKLLEFSGFPVPPQLVCTWKRCTQQQTELGRWVRVVAGIHLLPTMSAATGQR
jgi:hypothetical protein